MHMETLASGQGWSVSDVVCTSGPRDRVFEEQHPSVCIAAVMQGSFQYRTTQGAGTLVPGAVLLGNHRNCFECGHDHSTGDRCLSFMFDPDYFEAVLSSIGTVRTTDFRMAHLPPLMSLTRVFADAALCRAEGSPLRFEQLALDLAGQVATSVAECVPSASQPTRRDEQRIAAVLRRIETDASVPISVGDMARDVAMSPYHFLRTFRRVAGMTPHQFILRARLQDAAVQLRLSSRPVLDIVLGSGFGDLSTFNRRFRTTMGMTPTAYRRQDRIGRTGL